MGFTSGERVEVTFAGGKRRVCRVVEARKRVVFITSEAKYEEAQANGAEAEALIGVPIRDVAIAKEGSP
jgi:hypothetical protein